MARRTRIRAKRCEDDVTGTADAPFAGDSIGPVLLADEVGTHDVAIVGDRIASIRPCPQEVPAQWMALPAFANLHAHADRAFTAPRRRPVSLADAIELSAAARAAFTAEDVAERALRFFERSILHGVGLVRSHTDVDSVVGERSMRGVLRALSLVKGRLRVEVVAFSTAKNDLADPSARDRVREAVHMGADLVGSVPAFSRDPAAALDAVLDLAAELGRPADLHLDEHLDPERMLAGRLVDGVRDRGLQGRVTLSHGCALSVTSPQQAATIIDGLLAAGITVLALPETNLFLQDRGAGTPRRRGVTLIREMLAAGIPVRLGTDNVRDWFYPFGDGDPLDTALLAALAGQVDDSRGLLTMLCGGRGELHEGDPADLVLVRASSLDDALARRPSGRVMIRSGRPVR